jgi:hypothetical protein
MKIQGDSIIGSVVEYAHMQFGVELSIEEVSKQLKQLSLGQTLELVTALKRSNDDEFSRIIDLSVAVESTDLTAESGYGTPATSSASRATVRKQSVAANQANRQAKLASTSRSGGGKRITPGSKTVPTGNREIKDPDDQQRDANSSSSQQNSNEINRLKDLITKIAKGR